MQGSEPIFKDGVRNGVIHTQNEKRKEYWGKNNKRMDQ